MAHPFKPYEVRVLKTLLASEFSPKQLPELLDEATIVRIEYTEYGFYVEVEHPKVGMQRRNYSDLSIGRWQNYEAGFVVFLENNELTL